MELLSGNDKIGAKLSISRLVWPWHLTDDLKKEQGTSSMPLTSFCVISKLSMDSNWNYSPGTPSLGQNWRFLSCVTLKFVGWPWKTIEHLFCATSSLLFASFRSHLYIWTGVTSGNAQIWSKFALTSVTLTFDLWPWPFARTSLLSMVNHSRQVNDDTMRTIMKKACVTDRQTDRRTGPFIELLGRR